MPYKLLLADDSVTIQRVIELTFADEDVKVSAVGDGQQAIERIMSNRPDIVLADVGMPKRDGYEVAAFIKDEPTLAHIPVLLLTGAFEPVDEERAKVVRCDGVLAKPFEPQLLIARVKELLSHVTPVDDEDDEDTAQMSGSVVAQAAAPAAPAADESFDEDATVRLPRPSLPPPPPPPAVAAPLEAAPIAAPQPEGHADATLDDYFDRLDQAFAHLTGGQAGRDAAPRPAADPWAALKAAPPAPAIYTDDDLDPDRPRPIVFGPGPEIGASSSPADDLDAVAALTAVPVPDAFSALLEAERAQGAPAAHAPDPAAVMTVMLPGTAITESFVDDVARRVVRQLGERALRDVVTEIVSATAERLIREEIARLKASL